MPWHEVYFAVTWTKFKISRQVSDRFMFSFGSWNMLETLLGNMEFLSLQALNRFTYKTSISRTQTRWFTKLGFAFTFSVNDRHCVLYQDSLSQEWRVFDDKSLKGLVKSPKIFVNGAFFAIGETSPMTVCRFSHLAPGSKIRV